MTITLIWASLFWNYKPGSCHCERNPHPQLSVIRCRKSCRVLQSVGKTLPALVLLTSAELPCVTGCVDLKAQVGPVCTEASGLIISGSDDEWGQTCRGYQGDGNLSRKKPPSVVGFGSREKTSWWDVRYNAVDLEKRKWNGKPVCSHHWKQMTIWLEIWMTCKYILVMTAEREKIAERLKDLKSEGEGRKPLNNSLPNFLGET